MATIRKRSGSSGWEARVYAPDGRQVQKTFKRKPDAEAWAKSIEGKKVEGTYLDPRLGKTRLAIIAEAWVATQPGRKQNTRDGYIGLLNKHVLPALGNVEVGKITKARIRQFVADMREAGSAAGTIRNTFRNVLKPMLDLAVEDRYLLTNPAVGVKLPQSDRQEQLYLTAEEVDLLAKALGAPYGLLVQFQAYVGTRMGEAMALRVGNLDLMRGRVTIKESVSAVKGQGLTYGATKTYAVRTITLPRFLIDPLAAYIAPRAKDPNALVFATRNGRPLSQRTFMHDYFKPTVERLVAAEKFRPELENLRAHDLRHTCAALMIAINPNPKVIQTRLGHSTITTTFDLYGHLLPGADEDLAIKLDSMWRAGRDASAAR